MSVTMYHNPRCNTSRRRLALDQLTPTLSIQQYSTGTSTGAPVSLIKNTRNVAGLVLLAFRPTT